MDPDRAQDFRQVVIIGEDGPAIAIASQRLGREKGSGGHLRQRAGPLALVGGAEGLGRVFQDEQAVLPGQGR